MGRRVLGRPLTSCMLAGAVALSVAACGGGGHKSGGGGNGGGGTTAAKPSTGGTINKALGTSVFGTLPPSKGSPTSGGTISVSQATDAVPTFIFPIIDGAHVTTGTIAFVQQLFMPLYAGPDGAEPKIIYSQSAAAGPPIASDGDKTYTIHLKKGLKWANGAPIDANDVLFEYYILRAGVKESAANWAQYIPGQFPMSVTSATAPNKYTVVFHLNKAYNPGYFLNNQIQDTDNTFPLPSTDWNETAPGQHTNNWKNPAVAKKIFDFLFKQGSVVGKFASNPLWQDVSGPFKLKSFSPTNSSYVLVPNPNYGGSPKANATIDVNTYTSTTAALNALKGGSLDIDFGVDPSEIAQINPLKSQGIDLYGGPGWGWFGAQYNYLDKTNHFDKIISQLYIRQALAHLQNEPAIIKGIYKGAAVTAYGPTPSAPLSPYAPSDATTAPYPYNPQAAVQLLKSHGWKVVPNGQTTCQKAGSGPGECGAGIPKGTPFKFVWANRPQAESPASVLASQAIASEAKQAAGINIELQTKTFNFLVSNYNNANPAAKKYVNDWGVNNYGGIYEDYYPTQAGIMDHPGTGLNIGSYHTPEADKLINASVYGSTASNVKKEASFFEKSAAVLYGADQDYLIAVNSKKVASTDPAGWLTMTQQQPEPQYWYQVK
ncbi:MAG TPA: ABC transporter substrate-binding protein [Solirubrobacteraceae bacterium]|nr:ABC transporter substrate-binding protein [Solirubrobacteraceae bacterium]